jgi:hypothetical protein
MADLQFNEKHPQKEIFTRDPKKTYGLLELVEGTAPTVDKKPEQTEYTWPNLVYIELIAAIACLLVLTLWSLLVPAPLEDMGNPALTPNPAKAPWYFLGLQELLVYFDPWFAGVVMPSLIIFGLMAIPYLDFNTKAQGYYTFKDRKFAVGVFSLGYILWFIFIYIGVALRGPSWNWYWPWESMEEHKPIPGGLWSFKDGTAWIGWLLTAGFLFVMPVLLLGIKRFKYYFDRMGFVRYGVLMMFFMLMLLVPIKVIARLVFGIKYICVTPWFNV